MPLVRLVAEGVGPFDKLDMDLSDGHGNPHLGPHILAGVNGSGKTTVLRALAWVLDWGRFGFDYGEWQHALSGRPRSRAFLILKPPSVIPYVSACTTEKVEGWEESLQQYVHSALPSGSNGLPDLIVRDQEPKLLGTIAHFDDMFFQGLMVAEERPKRHKIVKRRPLGDSSNFRWARLGGPEKLPIGALFDTAAYAPSRSLKYIPNPDLTKILADPFENSLAFESTVQNPAIHAWLLSLYSKRAIARERGQPTEAYERSLDRFEKALNLVYEGAISFEVEIEPAFQPRLRVSGKSLNFSQLPDGVRSTVAWLADFMMRQDQVSWDPSLHGRRPGILLLDEVDAHLHPRWQRVLLPAMREALPDVQIIVTSHSPFVISSCLGSRVHVLETDDQGRAFVRPPVEAPIGQSVTATLKDIFGVDSRFDVLTEKDLNEWNDLKKRDASGKLSPTQKRRLNRLTKELFSRSEELRSIVAPAAKLSPQVVRSLVASKNMPGKGQRAAKR